MCRRSVTVNQPACKKFTTTSAGTSTFSGKKKVKSGSASTTAPKPVIPCTRCETHSANTSTAYGVTSISAPVPA